MATDYSTSPITRLGKVIFGLGCGTVTMFIRHFGSYPEGVSFAILFMNILVPYIDRATALKPFGGKKMRVARDIVKPTVTLIVIVMCISAAVVGTYNLTKEESTGSLSQEVLSAAEEMLGAPVSEVPGTYGETVNGVMTSENGKAVSVSPVGYSGGKIEMLVAFDPDYVIREVRILDISTQTPGIGQPVDSPEFTGQFVGKSGNLTAGTDVDIVTGATATSKGIINGVNAASAAAQGILDGDSSDSSSEEPDTTASATSSFVEQSAEDVLPGLLKDGYAEISGQFPAEVEAAWKSADEMLYSFSVRTQGYWGDIVSLITIHADGSVADVTVLAQGESSAKFTEEPLTGQFTGKNGPFTVGENIDAVAGATVSSTGLTQAVNLALEAFASLAE